MRNKTLPGRGVAAALNGAEFWRGPAQVAPWAALALTMLLTWTLLPHRPEEMAMVLGAGTALVAFAGTHQLMRSRPRKDRRSPRARRPQAVLREPPASDFASCVDFGIAESRREGRIAGLLILTFHGPECLPSCEQMVMEAIVADLRQVTRAHDRVELAGSRSVHLFLSHMAPGTDISRVTERLLATLRKSDSAMLLVGAVSLGAAVCPEDGRTAEELLATAHLRMRQIAYI